MLAESVLVDGQWTPIASLSREALIAIAQEAVGLLTQSAVAPGHFSSPIPSREDVQRYIATFPERPPTAIDGIALDLQRELALLDSFAGIASDFDALIAPDGPQRFRFENYYFAGADAFFMYAMLRRLQPKRVIEVGSGYSSALMLDVRDRFCAQPFDATFIDAYPDIVRTLIPPDERGARIIGVPVETCDLAIFRTLAPGDVLSIDSSHVFKAGSDLQFLLWNVFPLVPPGAFVHLHDIHYPFEYSAEMLLQGIHYNECYLVRALLTDNPTWEIELWAAHLAALAPERVTAVHPRAVGGSSLWIRRR